jgi:uncharacterized ferritin-like protein (DUF455 family)
MSYSPRYRRCCTPPPTPQLLSAGRTTANTNTSAHCPHTPPGRTARTHHPCTAAIQAGTAGFRPRIATKPLLDTAAAIHDRVECISAKAHIELDHIELDHIELDHIELDHIELDHIELACLGLALRRTGPASDWLWPTSNWFVSGWLRVGLAHIELARLGLAPRRTGPRRMSRCRCWTRPAA